MVLGILTSVAACPAIVGVNQAVNQGQKQNARDIHRGRKMNLSVQVSPSSLCFQGSNEIQGGMVILSGNKVNN